MKCSADGSLKMDGIIDEGSSEYDESPESLRSFQDFFLWSHERSRYQYYDVGIIDNESVSCPI